MYGMKGTIPATVKSKDGSSLISDADGTTVWFLLAKKASHRLLISAVFTLLLCCWFASWGFYSLWLGVGLAEALDK